MLPHSVPDDWPSARYIEEPLLDEPNGGFHYVLASLLAPVVLALVFPYSIAAKARNLDWQQF